MPTNEDKVKQISTIAEEGSRPQINLSWLYRLALTTIVSAGFVLSLNWLFGWDLRL